MLVVIVISLAIVVIPDVIMIMSEVMQTIAQYITTTNDITKPIVNTGVKIHSY